MRKTVAKNCLICNHVFEADKREHNRGNAKYCSRECTVSGIKFQNLKRNAEARVPNVECAYCKKAFYKNTSKKKGSRSGLFFCSRDHKDKGQRIESGFVKMQPSHYSSSLKDYRSIAFAHYPNKCSRCGYSKHPEVLEVHHHDRNRQNNAIENLCIVCPTCHEEEHFVQSDGKWQGRKTT